MSACGTSDCGTCVCSSGATSETRRPAPVLREPFAGADDALAVAVPQVLRESITTLRESGVPSPEADAAQLTAHLLGVEPGRLPAVAAITPAARAGIREAVRRRSGREPLQHITGEAGFRHLALHVGPGVFIPRPETEVVVESALALLPRTGPVTVVDLGAGSGAVGLAIATERADTTVYSVELDAGALPWLTQNVMRHAELLRRRGSLIRVVLGDAGAVAREDQPLSDLAGRVDLLVSNPPYIPDDLEPRDPEVRDFDPPLALYGGPDGLDAVRRWLDTAAELLAPGAALVVEHSDVQGGDDGVPGLLRRHEDLTVAGPVWHSVEDHLDLAGRSRYSVARRAAA